MISIRPATPAPPVPPADVRPMSLQISLPRLPERHVRLSARVTGYVFDRADPYTTLVCLGMLSFANLS